MITDGDDTLAGGEDDDLLDGGLGADTVWGNGGNDVILADSLGDRSYGGEGVDVVELDLLSETDNLNVVFASGALSVDGTELANGMEYFEIALGSGNDTLDAGFFMRGPDDRGGWAFGNSGTDHLVLNYSGLAPEGQTASQVEIDLGAGPNYSVIHLSDSTSRGGYLYEFDTASVTGSAGNDYIIGAAGASLLNGGAGADTLIGGAGNDTLNGGGQDDFMAGGAGDDQYVTDGADVIIESADGGTDLVRSSVNHALGNHLENLTLTGSEAIKGYGNGLDNVLTGNNAANLLSGGTGQDTLIGWGGDDTYVTDGNDTVREWLDGGTDLVRSSVNYALSNHVENLTLIGTDAIKGYGNGLDNVLTGNNAANLLSGGTGQDTLIGWGGDDIYVTDGNDTVREWLDGGTDLVRSSVNYALSNHVENLTLIGTDAIKGYGNGLDNVLTGNNAANLLSGGTGQDTLVGWGGDDIYVTDGNDTVTEWSNGGTDLVRSSVTYVLGNHVENLTLIGNEAIKGFGNTLANRITGNAEANAINGGLGNDTLTGGAGADRFVFNTATGSGNVDSVTDFSVVEDLIVLENAIFTGLANGTLDASAFGASADGLATDTVQRVLYETDTGLLSFDADGTGAGASVVFAVLTPGLDLTSADFLVY